jgi:HAD-superfamily hydrolase, subfamily IIB
MGKFDGVLLASDYDNTLVYTERALLSGGEPPRLSEMNRAALTYFMENGGRFTVSTGRALPSFEQLAPDVPMNAPCVVCNGAAIYDFAQGRYIYTALLDESARARGQQVLDAFPTVACEAYHVENVIHAVHPNAITRRHQHITHVGIEERASLMDVPLPLGKLLFEENRPILEQVRDFMDRQHWAEEYELIFSGQALLEMTRKGANKGGMVLRLAETLGIRRENLYCIGDESNDLPMLAVAAGAFAPANCVPAVRESGAVIVADAEHDALAEVVDILDRRY